MDLTGLLLWIKGPDKVEEQYCLMIETMADIFKLDEGSERIRWEE